MLLFAALVAGGGLAYKAVALSGINITSPVAGEYWSGTEEITWNADCGSELGQVQSVQLYSINENQSNFIGSAPCEDYSYSWDTGSLNGSYKIKAKASNDSDIYDVSGVFVIDNIDPEFVVVKGTDTGPVKTDVINVTVSDTNEITILKYGFSNNATCDDMDIYDTSFDSDVDFIIEGNHIDYLCVTAEDVAGNIVYKLVGQLNTDNTDPEFDSVDVDDIDKFYKAGDTISFIVDLVEADLTVTADLTVFDSALSTTFPLTHTGDGIYTGTTDSLLSDSMIEGINTVVTITATDQATNSATDNSLELTIDKTDPTVVITSSETGMASNANPIPMTITFNEEMIGFEESDITVGNGTVEASSLTSTDNKAFTVNINPTADGAVTVDIAAGVATDIAGNGNAEAIQFSIIYDGTAPTFTVTNDAETIWVASDEVVLTVNHYESGYGTNSIHKYVFIDNTTVCDSTVDFSVGTTYTSEGTTITVADESQNGKYLCFRADDLAGNIGHQLVGPFMIDIKSAIITITEDVEVAYVQSDDVVFTVDYTTSGAGDTGYVLTSGTCDNTTTGFSAYTSDATLTFNSETDDGKYVCLRARDAKGDQEGGKNYTYTVTGQLKIDRTNPIVTIDSVTTPTKINSQTITGTFTEAHISGIKVNTVDATITDNTYSATVNLTEGVNLITVVATDVAGNTGTNENTVTINLDITIPTIANLLPENGSIINDNTPEISADLGDNNSGIDANTIVITIDTIEITTGYTYDSTSGVVSYTSTTLGDSQYTVTIDVDDEAGNLATQVTTTFTVDTSLPVGTVGVGTPIIFDGDLVQEVTVTYNESMDLASTPTIAFGETVGTITGDGDGSWTGDTVWTESFTITDANEETTGVIVSSLDAKDIAGNVEEINTTAPTFDIDTKNPTLSPVSIASSNASSSLAKVGDTITLTFTADEIIQTTPIVKIAENLVTPNLDSSTNTSWIATYTMTDSDSKGTIPFTINFIDIAGNVGDTVTGTTDSLSVTFDKTVPTITLASITVNPTNGLIAVTAEFSEIVTDFVVDDITVTGGVAGTFAGTDSSYTFNVDPTDGANITVTIEVLAGKAIDVAGNSNTASNKLEYTSDTVEPTVGIVLTDTALVAGETTTVTFTFSEVPTGFTIEDVTTIENGDLSNLVVSSTDAKIYTAIFTPTADIEDSSNIITVGTGWTDAAGNAPVGTTNSADYTVETKKPSITLAFKSPNPTNGLIAVIAEFSEDVSGFDNTDITVGNGAVENFVAVDGDSYTFDVNSTDGENIIVTIEVLVDKAIDTAGNNNTASNQLTYISDTVAPSAPIVSDPAGAITINADTYTITGTAEANSLVQVYDSSSVAASEQLSGGTTNYSISVSLTENTANNFTVTATDAAENESDATTVPTITEDSIVPSAPDENKMTVQMNYPGIVDTISGGTGAVEGSATVKVYSDSQILIGSVSAIADGSFPAIDIGDNNHATVYVTATDAAGNESGSTAMVNDIAAPDAPTDLVLTDPVNDGNKTTVTITGTGEVDAVINWTISDEDGSTADISGTGVVEGDSDISITDIDVTTLADGILTLTLTLTDAAGNVSEAGTDTATKDVLAPNVEITSPLTGTKVNGDAIIIFTGSESATPQCSVGDSVWTTCVSGTTKLSNITGFSGLGEGVSFTLHLKDTDTAGNTGTDSEAGIIKDTVLPTITDITSDKDDGSYTVGEEIDIDVTFSENVSGDILVTLNTGGTCAFTIANASTDTCYYTVATGENTADLDATISGTIVDEAGNMMTSFTPTLAGNKDIVIDTKAPSLSEITSVSTPTNNPTPDYTFSSTEAGAITYAGDCGDGNITSAIEGNNTVTFSGLADGTYGNCVITVTDTANNSGSITVNTFVIDTTAPEITNETPTGVVNYTNPTISADFSEDVSGVDISGVTIQVTGGSISFDESYFMVTESGVISNTSEVDLDKNTTYTVTINGLKDGLENITDPKVWTFTISSNASEVDNEVLNPVQFPANGAENVAINTALSLTFYEEMQESTLTDSNIQLRVCGTTDSINAIVANEVINGKSKVTLTLSGGSLNNNTCYYFYVSAGVKDLADSVNSLDPTWTSGNQNDHKFTTEEEPVEDVPITSYDISLNAGWNLISLPLIPNDSSINIVLSSISDHVDIVWYYEDGEWFNNIDNSLTDMEDGKGYWVFMGDSSSTYTLTVNGTETFEGGTGFPGYTLVENDWNLIGFKSTTEMIAGKYVSDFTDHRLNSDSILWDYKDRDGDEDREYSISPLREYNNMESGYGYWLQGSVKK